jgi:CRISPR-associated protein Cmr2
MPDFLAQVALGPVQGFIAAARVMRDFAFGSQLLSHLANKTATHLHGRGAELIFPATVGAVNSNKIMVIFHDHTAQDVRQKLIETEQLVRAELHGMAQSFFSTFAPGQLESHDVAVWQVTDVLEYYWGMCGVSPYGYADAVRKLDQLMAARKMTRDFVSNQHASNHFKSSLTGTYESVIPESCYVRAGDDNNTRQQKVQFLRTRYGIHGAEYLSGVDLFKRLYQIPNVSLDFVFTAALWQPEVLS